MHGRRKGIRTGSSLWCCCAVAATVWHATPVALAQGRSATQAEVEAALEVLDRWRGRWAVTITTTRPIASTSTSVTTYAWTLGGRFLQADSGTKSDGTRDLSMMGYDAVARAYPLWIFSSTGIVYYLDNGQWDEATRTMLWDSGVTFQGSYRYRCRFVDDDNYRCRSIIKDWKGAVLLELEAVGTRDR